MVNEQPPGRGELVYAELDALVDSINSIVRTSALEVALSVGKLVVETFYGGSLDRWRQRGKGDPSIRQLAAHPRLNSVFRNPTAIYRAVGVWDLWERLGVSTVKHLGASHVYALLAAPPDRQAEILEAADRDAWSVDQVTEAVRAAAGAGPEMEQTEEERPKRGRPRLPRFIKATRELERVALDDFLLDLDAAPGLSREDVGRTLAALNRFRAQADELERQLRARLPFLPKRGLTAAPDTSDD